MTMIIRELRQKQTKLSADMRALLDAAQNESRDLTAEELGQFTQMEADYDALGESIAREERQAAREAALAGTASGGNPAVERGLGGAKRTAAAPNDTDEYRSAMLAYMVNGSISPGLILDGGEKRDILGVSLTGAGATGAVLAPVALERSLINEITAQNAIRQLADVRSSASEVDIPYVNTHTTAYLVGEGVAVTASTPAFAKHNMKAYKVGALSYITHEALQDMFIDMEAWVRDDFAAAFASLEETHFLTGTGSSQPSGVITGASSAVTTGSSTAISGDELISLIYAVDAKYRQNGSFVMKDSTVALLRKLKDGQGQYLWQPSLVAGQPDRLYGYPIYTSSKMEEATAGKKSVLFGDFKKFRILDRRGLYFQRLNEIAATTGQVGFLAFRRYDSKLLVSDAIKYITQKS